MSTNKETTPEYPKKRECYICGEEYEATSEESSCPSCFNGCSDPSFHNGGPCDQSC